MYVLLNVAAMHEVNFYDPHYARGREFAVRTAATTVPVL